MTTTYSVVRYEADGHSSPDAGRVVATGLSLEEAKRTADRGHGSWTPDADGEVIAFHESAREGCGGWLVREES